MSISILICDDLPEERIGLSRMLRSYEQAHGLEMDLETAADGEELLSLWKPDRWDVIFLDIYMPRMNGVEAARRLRKLDTRCEIVFATNSRAHGMEGYELHALDYLTKPFTQQDVDGVMDWFLRKRTEKRRDLTVHSAAGEETVRVGNILCIESRAHTCVIRTSGEEITVRRTIDELIPELGSGFFRCHKSFLVNLAHVTGIGQREFLLDDGGSVPISAANLSRSKTALLAWQSET